MKGIIQGNTIVLEQSPGLPDGQQVQIEIQPLDWLERFDVHQGKFVIRGTHRKIDDLIGQSDEALLQELTPEDVAAIREYARVPVAMRSAFGGWADDDEQGLDEYLAWNRQQRKVRRS